MPENPRNAIAMIPTVIIAIGSQVLAHAGEEDHRQAIAERSGQRVHRSLAEAHHVRSAPAERELLGHDVDRNAQHGAVGGDQRQEDAQRLVQGRGNLLQHDLDRLHEGRDDQDEHDGLHELV